MGHTNVLLIVLDCVRAGNTSLHGHRRKTTPNLEEFAAGATVYTQARTDASWSLPAHTSMLTGVPAAAHGVGITDAVEPGQTVFDRLAADGYDTGVFTENPYLTVHPSNLSSAFEAVVTERPDSTDADAETARNVVDGFWYADRVTEWVDEREGPWAACVNLMDAHIPYATREEYDDWGSDLSWTVHDALPLKWEWAVYGGTVPPAVGRLLEPLYDGAIRQADAVFGSLLSALGERGALKDTLVVVTSDHGDGFGEPGVLAAEPAAVMHGMGTHEALYHVPLVVKAPGQTEGRTVESLAALSRLPDAVDAATAGGTDDDGWFVAPDGRAVAHQQAADGQTAAQAREHTDDPERYLRAANIVYADGDGDAVHKRAAWGEETYDATVRGTYPDPTAETPIDDHPSEVAAAVAAGHDGLGVTDLEDGEGDMAEYETDDFEDIDVEERLESLGYL